MSLLLCFCDDGGKDEEEKEEEEEEEEEEEKEKERQRGGREEEIEVGTSLCVVLCLDIPFDSEHLFEGVLVAMTNLKLLPHLPIRFSSLCIKNMNQFVQLTPTRQGVRVQVPSSKLKSMCCFFFFSLGFFYIVLPPPGFPV